MKLNGEFGKSSEIKLNDEEIEPHEGDVFRFPFDVSDTADSPCPTLSDPVQRSRPAGSGSLIPGPNRDSIFSHLNMSVSYVQSK